MKPAKPVKQSVALDRLHAAVRRAEVTLTPRSTVKALLFEVFLILHGGNFAENDAKVTLRNALNSATDAAELLAHL